MPLPQIESVHAAATPTSTGARRHRSRLSSIVCWPFFIACVALIAFGLLVCWSAVQTDADYSFSRQLLGVAMGIVACMALWMFDYRKFGALTYPLLIVSVILILSPHLPFIGRTVKGATSWIYIGMQVQPAEFAKVTVVLFAASLLSRYNGRLFDLREYCKCVGLLLVPFLCIMTQPDLGTGLVYLFISAVVLVMGGARLRYLLITLAAFIATIVAVFAVDEVLKYQLPDGTWEYKLLKNYQRTRLFVFMNQDSLSTTDEGYNLKQAMIAIGSGGLFGKGLGFSTQSALGFLPEAPTDFIFCVLAEELGFFGVVVLIALYALLIGSAIYIARTCGNLFGMLIVCAIVGMWLFQILENIGMCCGLMPITGIPLPFVSYGSSFMTVNFAMLGLISSVYSHEMAPMTGAGYGSSR